MFISSSFLTSHPPSSFCPVDSSRVISPEHQHHRGILLPMPLISFPLSALLPTHCVQYCRLTTRFLLVSGQPRPFLHCLHSPPGQGDPLHFSRPSPSVLGSLLRSPRKRFSPSSWFPPRLLCLLSFTVALRASGVDKPALQVSRPFVTPIFASPTPARYQGLSKCSHNTERKTQRMTQRSCVTQACGEYVGLPPQQTFLLSHLLLPDFLWASPLSGSRDSCVGSFCSSLRAASQHTLFLGVSVDLSLPCDFLHIFQQNPLCCWT